MDMRTADSIDRWENEGGFVNGVRALATMIVAGFCRLIRDSLKDRRREKWVGTIAGLVIVVLGSLMLVGCVADADQKTQQASNQRTETPTTNAQATDTQGFSARFTWHNSDPSEAMLDGGPAFATTQPGDDDGMVDDYKADIASAGHRRSKMGYQQTNIFTITTGGTAPIVTGSATGTGTGSQTSSQDGKQDQKQDNKAGVTANLANTPGGVANQSGAAAGAGNASNTQDNQVDQRIARLEAAAEQQSQYLVAIMQALNAAKIPPVTTMPVETHGGTGSGN